MRVEGILRTPVFIPGTTKLVLSGGAIPAEKIAGSVEVIKTYAENRIPILGICIGSMGVVLASGGTVSTSGSFEERHETVTVTDDPIFKGVKNPFQAWCAHREVIETTGDLQVIGRSAKDEIMAVRHPHLPIFGFQFHPEHINTEDGARMILNFLGEQ